MTSTRVVAQTVAVGASSLAAIPQWGATGAVWAAIWATPVTILIGRHLFPVVKETARVGKEQKSKKAPKKMWWTYRWNIAVDLELPDGRIVEAGAPGYLGYSGQHSPSDRWDDADHPVQQEWSWMLDVDNPEVWGHASKEKALAHETAMIAAAVAQKLPLLNIKGVPKSLRIPRVAQAVS